MEVIAALSFALGILVFLRLGVLQNGQKVLEEQNKTLIDLTAEGNSINVEIVTTLKKILDGR